MTECAGRMRMPWPVLAALGIIALIAVAFGLAILDRDGGYSRTEIATGPGSLTFIAVGLWRGWRPAQAFAVMGGSLTAFGSVCVLLVWADPHGYDILGLLAAAAVGATLAGLLIVPARARDWFDYKH